MKDLEEFGVLDSEGNKLTEDAIVDIEEVREWATYLALHVIYKTSSNANEDVFKAKAADYFNKAKQSRTRSFFKFDYNGDGSIDKNEWINLQAIEVYRT
jgi:Ca2+-binding EF-hand superfamily protein